MSHTSRLIATAVGTLGLLCVADVVRAQTTPATQTGAHLGSFASGAIQGLVQDETGAPVAGAIVSALGASTAVAVTDRSGRFELKTLSPGPYILRAHLGGFTSPRGQVVQVQPSTRVSSALALRHVHAAAGDAPPLVPASVGGSLTAVSEPPDEAPTGSVGTTSSDNGRNPDSGRDETAWRLRHARRSILNDAMEGAALLADSSPNGEGDAVLGIQTAFGRAVGSPARAATNFFTDTSFVGQVNLLTTGSFDTPQDLFTTRRFDHNVALVSVGAPVGEHADWTMRGAMTQGDLSAWIVSGEYTTRAPARHRYNTGLSYSTQRYDGGNPAALRDVTDGSRNAGTIYGFDTFALTSAVSLAYGARYARYDYLDGRSLLSPRVAVSVAPTNHVRINAIVARRALAPGAEEFAPPPESGVWLPPQRTFSALIEGQPLTAEHATDLEAQLERDLGAGATVSLRAFRQHVDGQLVTLFGVDMPGQAPASLGHYFVADEGGADTSGYAAGVRAVFANRVHGSLEYTTARSHWNPAADLAYLVLIAPSAARAGSERVHDVAASIEADIPETSTRVMIVCRVSTGFAHRDAAGRSGLDSRFDVQVHQSLPFMDFSSARWEMLVDVRDFFRDPAVEQSVYDELLVVRPPKRVVGGLTLRF